MPFDPDTPGTCVCACFIAVQKKKITIIGITDMFVNGGFTVDKNKLFLSSVMLGFLSSEITLIEIKVYFYYKKSK